MKPHEPGDYDYTLVIYPMDAKPYHQGYASEADAIRYAKRKTESVAGRLGQVEIIQVYEMDRMIWEWQYGKGITFPDAAELAKGAGGDDEEDII